MGTGFAEEPMGARILVRLLSCICALGVVHAAAAQPRTRHFADIDRITCAEGAERYLPGDYYFCSANRALQAGDTLVLSGRPDALARAEARLLGGQ